MNIYWKIKNLLEVNKIKLLQTKSKDYVRGGLLSEKKDLRDKLYIGGMFERKPKHNEVLIDEDYVFNQTPFNICVFASAAIGSSHQEGIRFSTKFYVKLARRLGMIEGNGFSYLRAARKIEQKYGRLPYEYMPDEINGESWAEYSKWDVTDHLLEIASNYRTPEYSQISTPSEAIEALESGLVIFTGNKWYSNMNYPAPKDYFLQEIGNYLGGHAWFINGYRAENGEIKDFKMKNSFGESWGLKGKGHIKRLFSSGMFSLYVSEKIPVKKKIRGFVLQYDRKAVKGNGPAVYQIRGGKKYYFKNEAHLYANNQTFTNVSQEILDEIPDGGEFNF